MRRLYEFNRIATYSVYPIVKCEYGGETAVGSRAPAAPWAVAPGWSNLHRCKLNPLIHHLRPRLAPAGIIAWAALYCAVLLSLLSGIRLACAAGNTLSIEFTAPAPSAGPERASEPGWTIFIDGRIDEGAAGRLRDELAARDIVTARVYLNSPGGLLLEGMELGRLIREHGYATYIGRPQGAGTSAQPGSCSSACVFAFIGGVYRFAPPQSRVGVHRFSSDSPTGADPDMVQRISAAIIAYIREMGVDVDLFDRMSRRGKEQLLILTERDLQQLRVVNAGRLPAEWSIEASGGTLHLNGVQQTSDGTGELSFSCKDGQVLFRPVVEVNESSADAVDSVVRHSIRIGSWLEPLAEPVEPISVQDGRASAVFALAPEQIRRMQSSPSVGYEAQLRDLSSYVNVSVDTGGSVDKIRKFLKGCER